MDVKIYRPAKSVTQSGRAVRSVWILEFESIPDGTPDSLMGWAQGSNPRSLLRLKFSTCERAISYAKKQGLNYTVFPENYRKIKPHSDT
ncbi:MAG: ETC complex I subunit [Alphaproteobacteria bacterium]|nr:ETC complex I subunit [Alphaproteobacteria bacterium]